MRNPLSLEGLIAWLEKQPAETTYHYMNTDDCLFCRYLRVCGFPLNSMGGDYWRDNDGNKHALPKELQEVPLGATTYGAALERARQLAMSGGAEAGAGRRL